MSDLKLDGDVRAGSSLREIRFRPGYSSADETLHGFYVPALQRAGSYDRSVGYFRSSSLSVAARGMSRFIASGGQVRLLVGPELTEADAQALRGAVEIHSDLAQRLAAALVTEDDVDRRRLEVLAWLARTKRLEVKVAVPLGDDGEPMATVGEDVPYFHEKIGVLRDPTGDGVAFQGSVNESARAWMRNFESFSVYRSWDGTREHFDHWASEFEHRWQGQVPRFRVYPLPQAVYHELISYAPDEPPSERDPQEPGWAVGTALLAQFLRVAPRLPTAVRLPEETVGVELFPHQRQVVERLAGTYPRSWLVADEVGLGKTISAGLALRRLWLSGQVRRALVLAPANVVRQWQDELFEKFGLWVPRLEAGHFHGVHEDEEEPVPPGENPYRPKALLLASSHLARRAEHRRLILEAAPFDLLIVDEAHHARRRKFADLTDYRPSLLLRLLDELRGHGRLSALWLLTATPMQVHPIELRDLLIQVGLSGSLSRWSDFQRWHRELAKSDAERPDWNYLAKTLRDTPMPPPSQAEETVLHRIDVKLGLVARSRIERFTRTPGDLHDVAGQLGPAGRAELRNWLRQRGPVGQLLTRHSRDTLRRYRDQGLLQEPIAERDPHDVVVPFDSDEERLYKELDNLIDRLRSTHRGRRNAGFVLTIYQRRLTSSWYAIRRTLQRRVAREGGLDLELDLLSEAEVEELVGRTVDDADAVPLNDDDLEQIAHYLDDLRAVEDSKLHYLKQDLAAARGSGQAAIVFSQFTDTMTYLRDHFVGAYRDHLATFSGEGGRMYDPARNYWYRVSKQNLVEAVRTGRCSVILATDAASEGLNLQACSYLVNYDLPWNPMRVEQRIGRIDRIGQQRPVITVRNYIIPNTIETQVHAALKRRIGDFHQLVGRLQPILGATEQAVRTAYDAGLEQRGAVVEEEIEQLLDQLDHLQGGGIDLVDEDPLPIPDHPAPPVTLDQLEQAVIENLQLQIASPGRPVTFDATRASRDPTDWAALVTYGHPRLDTEIARLADDYNNETGPIFFAQEGEVVTAYRADRNPPEPVRTLDELNQLGEPHARGEAQGLAREHAAMLAREGRATYRAALALRETDWEANVRERFRQLVRDKLAARVALRELTAGEEATADLAWFDLRDETDTWRYAETFRQHLDIPLTELLPTRADIATAKGRRRQLEDAARGGELELESLMREWGERTRGGK